MFIHSLYAFKTLPGIAYKMQETTLVKSARGSGYNLITNAATMVLGFTRSVLLMRLLDPELFRNYCIVTILYNLNYTTLNIWY